MSTHSWNRWLVIWYFPTTFELRFRKGWYVYVIRSYGTAHWPASCFDYVSPWRRGSVIASWYQSYRLRVLLSVEIDVTMRKYGRDEFYDDMMMCCVWCQHPTSQSRSCLSTVRHCTCTCTSTERPFWDPIVLAVWLTNLGSAQTLRRFSFLKKERLLLTG